MSVAICQGPDGEGLPHCPLLLYAGGHGEDAPFNSVQAEQGPHGYELTNRYMDGVLGVHPDDEVEAEVDESPCCTCCTSEISHWQHGTAEEWAELTDNSEVMA